MDLFDAMNESSSPLADSIKLRMNAHLPKIVKQISANSGIHASMADKKEIIEKIFAYAFGYMQHAKLRESGEYLGNNIYKITTQVEQCLVWVLIINDDKFSENINSSDLSQYEYAPKYIVETNLDLWKLYEATVYQNYKIVAEANLKDDNLDKFIFNAMPMCKEFTSLVAITDIYNRKRIYKYFDTTNTTIEFSIQFEFILFEDSSEVVWLPEFNKTFWSNDLIGARNCARQFISKYIEDKTGKKYKSENQSEALNIQDFK